MLQFGVIATGTLRERLVSYQLQMELGPAPSNKYYNIGILLLSFDEWASRGQVPTAASAPGFQGGYYTRQVSAVSDYLTSRVHISRTDPKDDAVVYTLLAKYQLLQMEQDALRENLPIKRIFDVREIKPTKARP